MKQKVLVKLAGSDVYNKHIKINPAKLTNIMKFPKEVFADIDGIRIVILREEYEKLIKKMKELKFSKTKLNLWTLRPNGKYKLVKIPMKYKEKYLKRFSTLIVHPTEVIETWLYKQQQIYYAQ